MSAYFDVLHGGRDVERGHYRGGAVRPFEPSSPVASYEGAAPLFEREARDPRRLARINLPTSEALGTDVFMRLADYPIYLVGVTGDPIA